MRTKAQDTSIEVGPHVAKYLLLKIFFNYAKESAVPDNANFKTPYDICCEFVGMN